MPTKQMSVPRTVMDKKPPIFQSNDTNRLLAEQVKSRHSNRLCRVQNIALGAEKERLDRVTPKIPSVRGTASKPNPVTSELEHAKWLEQRQVVERHNSLLRRLEGLAQDAQIERLDKAAALLRQTAEAFRTALREKYE